MRVACAEWHDIDPPYSYEFMVFMTLEADKEKRVASWQDVYIQTKKKLLKYNQQSQKEIELLHQENAQLKEELHSMYGSSSWRITAPFRAMMQLLKSK